MAETENEDQIEAEEIEDLKVVARSIGNLICCTIDYVLTNSWENHRSVENAAADVAEHIYDYVKER